MIHAIAPNLSIGDLEACRSLSSAAHAQDWVIIHACKDPCHRALLGYSGRALDPSHPGYLATETQDPAGLYLNLVDAADSRFFHVPLLSRALDYIQHQHAMSRQGSWKHLLIHCNQGKSRSAGLALLYLFTRLSISPTYDEAKARFVQQYYPGYEPGKGLDTHLREKWPEYAMDGFCKSPGWTSMQSPDYIRKNALYGRFID